MIIKFIKNTKRNRIGQVVEADFKIVHRHLKNESAIESNQNELDAYILKLSNNEK